MSCNGWEEGQLLLPSAAVTDVKNTVRKACNDYRQAVLAVCHDFWEHGAKRTRSPRLYDERLDEYFWRRPSRSSQSLWSAPSLRDSSEVREAAYDICSSLRAKPRKVTQADLDRYYIPKATNRTNEISFDEARIRFDGRKLQWSTGHNNHQVERAHSHPIAQALFAKLQRVDWTRGTGGVLVGNDEYNRDSSDAGGGANYITRAYGPLGERQRRTYQGW